ncbi:hypothetical protein EW026_g5324 [Hermanssonia centrifuga]|uniref:Uncharacterized protein n=1 Tax=Hermanssonia centrifuga TaxID=98765 RepID=A0A4V3XA37_9APHY|nr:hypothetical protein EW026_g5324 [Hermanssonia centrifuga]
MEKPLPDVPHPSAGAGNLKSPRGPGTKRATQISTNTTTLTIDARDHLHQFILAALEGEGEEKEGTSAGSSESERLEWAVGLETALGALGERISLGGWLPGLRRARTRRRQEKELARAKERASSKRMESTDTVMPSRKEEGTLKSKGTLHHPHFDPKDELGYLSAGLKDGEKAEEGRRASVQLLRDLASRPGVATPKPTAKHLLLTVTSYGAPVPPPPEDMGYEFDETLVQSDAHGAVLYGLETWDLGPSAGSDTLQIVGGTFSFRGVLSEAQHAALTKVLRLSIYVYLSNILEQSLLSNSHVPLRFPKPSMSPTTQAGPMSRALSTSHVGSKHHKRDSQSGLWAFFSRKKETLLQRSSTPGVGPFTRTTYLRRQHLTASSAIRVPWRLSPSVHAIK